MAARRPELPSSKEREEIKRLRQENFELRHGGSRARTGSYGNGRDCAFSNVDSVLRGS
jgi:hypothetical protein